MTDTFKLAFNAFRGWHPDDGIDIEFTVFSPVEFTYTSESEYSEETGTLWVRLTPSALARLPSITRELGHNPEAAKENTDIQTLANVALRKMSKTNERHPLIITVADLLEVNAAEPAA